MAEGRGANRAANRTRRRRGRRPCASRQTSLLQNSALLQKSVNEHAREKAYADVLSDDDSLDRSSFRALSRLRRIRTLQIVRTDIDCGLGSSLEKLQQLHALVLSDVEVSDEDMKCVAQRRKLGVLYVDSSTLTETTQRIGGRDRDQ